MEHGTCGDCVYWARECGVDIVNPNPLGRPLLPRIRVAPCSCPGVLMCDTPEAVAFLSADADCTHYGDGFSPTRAALLRQAPETRPIIRLGAPRPLRARPGSAA